jgi:NADPH-dependent curcumin reductase CurA
LAAENSVDRVPNDIPVEYAATLCVNPATAYLLLNQFVKLKAGDVIVQNAANSVCGQVVIQLAKMAGIKTVNIIRDRYVAINSNNVVASGTHRRLNYLCAFGHRSIAAQTKLQRGCRTAEDPGG